jgi:hypothetical protein
MTDSFEVKLFLPGVLQVEKFALPKLFLRRSDFQSEKAKCGEYFYFRPVRIFLSKK